MHAEECNHHSRLLDLGGDPRCVRLDRGALFAGEPWWLGTVS